jgi:hypothetical protein
MPPSLNASDIVLMLNRQPVPTEHLHLLIAAMPKSASTFLESALAAIPGLAHCNLVPSFDWREQEIGRAELVMHHHEHYFAKCHLRFSGQTLELMQHYGLKVVVTSRNLFDVVISLCDHYRKGDFQPMAIPPANVRELDDPSLQDFVINFVVPWLIVFHVSWQRCPLPVFRLSYETLVQNPEGTLRDLLHFSGVELPGEVIDQAVFQAKERKERFNRGTTGRGEASLSPERKERIRSLTRFYPGIDFSVLGI